MVGMGFTTEEIKDSLLTQKYNEVTATYLLLGLKTEVIHNTWDKQRPEIWVYFSFLHFFSLLFGHRMALSHGLAAVWRCHVCVQAQWPMEPTNNPLLHHLPHPHTARLSAAPLPTTASDGTVTSVRDTWASTLNTNVLLIVYDYNHYQFVLQVVLACLWCTLSAARPAVEIVSCVRAACRQGRPAVV